MGNTVGKSVGNVGGIWPGDAVRNGWEHDREHGLETTVENRKMMPSAICQLLKRTFATFFCQKQTKKLYQVSYDTFFFETFQALIYRLIAEACKEVTQRRGGGGGGRTHLSLASVI